MACAPALYPLGSWAKQTINSAVALRLSKPIRCSHSPGTDTAARRCRHPTGVLVMSAAIPAYVLSCYGALRSMTRTTEVSMAGQIPLVDYLVLGDGDPHLVAQECANCGARFFDRRNACASCFASDFSPVAVPDRGDGAGVHDRHLRRARHPGARSSLPWSTATAPASARTSSMSSRIPSTSRSA